MSVFNLLVKLNPLVKSNVLYLAQIFIWNLVFANQAIKQVNPIIFFRLVSLDLRTNMSAEVEVLCNQAECDFQHPERITVVKDKMYIVHDLIAITVSKG